MSALTPKPSAQVYRYLSSCRSQEAVASTGQGRREENSEWTNINPRTLRDISSKKTNTQRTK